MDCKWIGHFGCISSIGGPVMLGRLVTISPFYDTFVTLTLGKNVPPQFPVINRIWVLAKRLFLSID